ncbi:MAG: SGNH/GDSL hydrolase family protein [Verrucomicrobiota bacterium]|nr:SGNH/GDSL hydrolase family protein [Verrucomicrobiota bacterium]
MTRSVVTVFAAALCFGCFLLATDGIAKTARAAKKSSPSEAPTPTRVLMIGDSLSVGAFGEAVQFHLAKNFGSQNVAAYASCGSSPENWLRSERDFVTKCGYREATPETAIMRDFVNGHHPRPTTTPKIESLVRRFHPTVVVVQQGTNWMDRNLSDGEMSSLLDRFITAARSAGGVNQIVWIEPPDSSAMKRSAQNRVHRLIKAAAQRDNFAVIDSRLLTSYRRGKSGGDGIHYNSEASREWAAKLNPLLDAKLRPRIATR